MVELSQATLSENLEAYFLRSEQLPSRLFLASTEHSVTGLLLQRLPSADFAPEVTLADEQDAWHTITTLADTVTVQELVTLPAPQLLVRLFSEYPCRLYPGRTLSYQCTCSRHKSDRTLRILDSQELTELLAEQHEIHVDCEFCGARYTYDAIDISELQNTPASAPSSDTRH